MSVMNSEHCLRFGSDCSRSCIDICCLPQWVNSSGSPFLFLSFIKYPYFYSGQSSSCIPALQIRAVVSLAEFDVANPVGIGTAVPETPLGFFFLHGFFSFKGTLKLTIMRLVFHVFTHFCWIL